MKKVIPLFALLVAALALAACGGGSSSSSSEETSSGAGGAAQEESTDNGGEAGGSAAKLEIEASPEGNLEFVQKSLTAKAGKVEVDFTNDSPIPHDVVIEGPNGEEVGGTEVIAEGSDSTEVELKPGTYTYYCSITGHRDAGMEGTLTVE